MTRTKDEFANRFHLQRKGEDILSSLDIQAMGFLCPGIVWTVPEGKMNHRIGTQIFDEIAVKEITKLPKVGEICPKVMKLPRIKLIEVVRFWLDPKPNDEPNLGMVIKGSDEESPKSACRPRNDNRKGGRGFLCSS
jgi:hypothetical protein